MTGPCTSGTITRLTYQLKEILFTKMRWVEHTLYILYLYGLMVHVSAVLHLNFK